MNESSVNVVLKNVLALLENEPKPRKLINLMPHKIKTLSMAPSQKVENKRIVRENH